MRRVLLFIICMFLGIIISFNFYKENDFICYDYKEENLELVSNYEKSLYKNNEYIPINFQVNDDLMIKEYYIEADGFFVQNQNVIGNIVSITVLTDDSCELSNLNIKVELENNSILFSKVYGFCCNYGTFISSYSFENAKQLYYEYLYINNLISIDEMHELINNDILQELIIEVDNSKINNRQSSVELSTRLMWKDDFDVEHPLSNTKFQIIDYNSPSGNTTTTTYYTDIYGYFPSGIYAQTPTNLEIKIYASGGNSVVNYVELLIFETPWNVYLPYDESVIKITTPSPTTSDYARAQQVSQSIIYAEKYAVDVYGSSLSNVNVIYPANNTNYDPITNKIRIKGTESSLDYYDWDVIMHEYGHHFNSELGLENSPSLNHYSCENLSDRYDKSRGIRLAWDEALATLFGGMAQEYYKTYLTNINHVADGGYSDGEGVSYYYNNPTHALSNIEIKGESCEQTIIAILWDLFDVDEDSESHDLSEMTHFDFWSIVINSGATTLSEFVEYYYLIYTNYLYRQKIGKILEYYKISPSDIHLSTNLDNLHYDIPTFLWTSNGTSSSLLNNLFSVYIFSDDFEEYIHFSTTNTYLTLSTEQWNTIINWPCEGILISVYGYQTDTPQTGPYGQGFTYFYKPQFKISSFGNDIVITGLYYETESLDIPHQLNSCSIVSIQNSAFECCENIVYVSIPISITSIGYEAFKNCTSLETITINRAQKNLITLGTNAFQGCTSLNEIIVPRDRIADYKNSWSNYRSIIIPNNNSFPYYDIDEDSNINIIPFNIDPGYNILYKLNVIDKAAYVISVTSGTNPLITLYNSSFTLIDSSSSSINEILLNNHTYYLSIEHSNTTSSGSIYVNIQKDPNHVHIYDNYIWYNYTKHKKECDCGESGGYQPHAVEQGSFQPGQQYATCILCGGQASIGLVGLNGNNLYPTSLNGSYILPNGVIVLASADIDSYLDGTLVFIDPNTELINNYNNYPYLLKREDNYFE